MVDYTEFKKVLSDLDKKLDDVFLVHSRFRDIGDMVKLMIEERDKRIKELEGTSPKVAPEKPKKECPPGKIVNPKTGRCINKPKEKTHKKPGIPNKTVVVKEKQMSQPNPEKSLSENFHGALEYIRNDGKPGSYRKHLNDIKRKYGITLKYNNHGDLYFMKNGKEVSRTEMEEVMKYVVYTAGTIGY